MPIIHPNAVAMRAGEKRDRIIACLKETRCPMTPLQVREWLQDHDHFSITEAEARRQLGILFERGGVDHPSPENQGQFVWRRS